MVATSNPAAREAVNDALAACFQLTPSTDPTEFTCLNWRIIQSATHITMDQSDHIMKMCHSYFKGRTPTRCDIPFRTDSQVEDDYASASQCLPSDLLKLERQYGAPFRSLHGEV